jgi:hypothetical protein
VTKFFLMYSVICSRLELEGTSALKTAKYQISRKFQERFWSCSEHTVGQTNETVSFGVSQDCCRRGWNKLDGIIRTKKREPPSLTRVGRSLLSHNLHSMLSAFTLVRFSGAVASCPQTLSPPTFVWGFLHRVQTTCLREHSGLICQSRVYMPS